MTNGTDRLDRIESILANLAERQDRFQIQLEEGDRNFRESINDLTERQDRFQTQLEENDRNLRESIDDVVSLISNLAEQDNQRAAEYRQRHEAHEQRFNNLLEEARADRRRSDERADANAAEHRAFQQIVQTMLAEINRKQRLAG